MVTIFPLDENDMPTYPTTLTMCSALGAGTVIWANLIHKYVFYNRPWAILVGGVIGLVGGHVLHKESVHAWRMLRLRNEYRDRLRYQYERDHP